MNRKLFLTTILSSVIISAGIAQAAQTTEAQYDNTSVDNKFFKLGEERYNFNDFQVSDAVVSEGLIAGVNALSGIFDGRVDDVAVSVAAGDVFESYGVWIKGTYTRGEQKEYNSSPGYKLDQKGVTIGADTGDESMIGVAYSYYMNDIKNKTNSSNKDDIKSHTGTLYGKYSVTDEAFVNFQAQYGSSEIEKKRATGDEDNNMATAKPSATTLATKGNVGYSYIMDNRVYVIPTVGLSYVDVKVDKYTETGGGLNRTVSERKTTRTSGTAGLKVRYLLDMGSVQLMPEVHADIDYAFSSKNSDTKVLIIDGLDPISTPAQDLAKGYYNVGASLKAQQGDMYEFSFGYNFGFAKKFQSHTGTLRLRVDL